MPDPTSVPPAGPPMADGPPVIRHTERLFVPPGWWALGAGFCLSLGLAAGWYVGAAAGVLGTLSPLAVLIVLFVSYGAAPVRVDAAGLTAGRARIEPGWIGSATALTAAQARDRRGPRADPRAYLLLRPYLSEAVEITIDDPADPAPYWLISSRRPRRLAAAVNALAGHPDRPSAGPGPGPVGSSGDR